MTRNKEPREVYIVARIEDNVRFGAFDNLKRAEERCKGLINAWRDTSSHTFEIIHYVEKV